MHPTHTKRISPESSCCTEMGTVVAAVIGCRVRALAPPCRFFSLFLKENAQNLRPPYDPPIVASKTIHFNISRFAILDTTIGLFQVFVFRQFSVAHSACKSCCYQRYLYFLWSLTRKIFNLLSRDCILLSGAHFLHMSQVTFYALFKNLSPDS